MNLPELITLIISIALTLMVFSYILGDRLFFGIATHILIGVSAGFLALVAIQKVILPYLILPLADPDGQGFWLALVPLVLSILLLLTLFRRGIQAGAIPLAFLGGVMAALAIVGVTRGTLAPQILSMLGRFEPAQLMREAQPQWSAILEALMILLGVIFCFVCLPPSRAVESWRVGPTRLPRRGWQHWADFHWNHLWSLICWAFQLCPDRADQQPF